MTDEAKPYWEHATKALESAQNNIELDPATAANRAYYAAFYAISALLVMERGKALKRHTAVEAAVFRDLERLTEPDVAAGLVPATRAGATVVLGVPSQYRAVGPKNSVASTVT